MCDVSKIFGNDCMTTFRNTTVDPRARATAVKKPQIPEIMSKKTGTLLDASAFIVRHRYDHLVNKQSAIRRLLGLGEARYYCPICHTPVYICTSLEKRFFFKHKVEDGSCPAITHDGRSYDQMKAMKYMGARESEPHKRMKSRIARSLYADERYKDIFVERTVKSRTQRGRWRRPDVQVCLGKEKIAFEAQLSTTFLDVVLSRQDFYRDEGILLVWVMNRFSPDYRRLTDDRILFMNNSNMLVVDEETTVKSEQESCFFVRCIYRRPQFNGRNIEDIWEEQVVPFHELTRYVETQQAFFFDFLEAEKVAEGEYEKALQKEIYAIREKLRRDFLELWSSLRDHHSDIEEINQTQIWWRRMHDRFSEEGLQLPVTPLDDDSFRDAISAIMSAKMGKVVGFDYQKLIQIAHHLFDHRKENLIYFGHALEKYGTKALISEQDRTGKWRKRSREIRKSLMSDDVYFLPKSEWIETILFLFPDIEAKVRQYLHRSAP